MRIEDIDTPRVVPGSDRLILDTLEALGMHWDAPPARQSRRGAYYQAALERLQRDGLAYACGCTRRQVGTGVYAGTCRHGLPVGREPRSLRVRTDRRPVSFHDLVQGPYSQVLERQVGDFVVRRGDGITAYQLAVVVDDAAQGITEVVRGSDLLDSTPRQIHLQRLLGLPTPRYAHLPVAVDGAGHKLSKQTHAPAVDAERPVPTLVRVLGFLGQRPPRELREASLAELWDWAIGHWRLASVPRRRALGLP